MEPRGPLTLYRYRSSRGYPCRCINYAAEDTIAQQLALQMLKASDQVNKCSNQTCSDDKSVQRFVHTRCRCQLHFPGRQHNHNSFLTLFQYPSLYLPHPRGSSTCARSVIMAYQFRHPYEEYLPLPQTKPVFPSRRRPRESTVFTTHVTKYNNQKHLLQPKPVLGYQQPEMTRELDRVRVLHSPKDRLYTLTRPL